MSGKRFALRAERAVEQVRWVCRKVIKNESRSIEIQSFICASSVAKEESSPEAKEKRGESSSFKGWFCLWRKKLIKFTPIKEQTMERFPTFPREEIDFHPHPSSAAITSTNSFSCALFQQCIVKTFRSTISKLLVYLFLRSHRPGVCCSGLASRNMSSADILLKMENMKPSMGGGKRSDSPRCFYECCPCNVMHSFDE